MKLLLILSSILLFARSAYAASEPKNFQQVIKIFIDILLDVLPIAFTLSVVVFIFMVARFIYKADSEDEREKGKQTLLWGVLVLFVLFTIWGILSFLSGELEFGGISVPVLPT